MRDPRTGRYLASVTSWFYGPDLDHRRPRRRMAAGRGHGAARGRGEGLERIWVIVPGEADGDLYAGGDPACCSRAATAASRGRSTAACGTTPRAPTGTPGTAVSASTRSRPGPATPTAPGRDLRGGRVALRRRRRDVAPLEHGDRARLRARGGARQPHPALRARRPSLARGPSGSSCSSTAASTAPTTREQLDRHRRGTALRLRLPDRRRPRRSGQRLRHPADRRARTARRPTGRARLGDARRGRDMGAARRRAPGHAYLTILREAFDNAGEGAGLELYFGATSARSSVPTTPARTGAGRRPPAAGVLRATA